ncbi:MAG: vitamin K epoxide reductase family protein [Gammaproteobacteria bacterium]|nr:vitamin K epoxide reductase family protein [Gammaproteobacteria bacterium]
MSVLLQVWVLLLPGWVAAAAADSVAVKAVVFYPPLCRECPAVLDDFLFSLSDQYGERLELYPVDITLPSGSKTYHRAWERFGVGPPSSDAPAILVGDQLLSGKAEILGRFPTLLEDGLSAGGTELPVLPGLPELIAEEDVAAGTAPSSAPDIIATGLAWAVMLLLLLSLAYAAWRLAHTTRVILEPPPVLTWKLPVLASLGIGIGGYLSYTALTHNEVMCGPVGDCLRVQSSAYAYLVGIPLSMWGLVFYLGISGLWLLQRLQDGVWRYRATLGLIVCSIFGVLFSIYLTGLELFVIHAVCVWCLTSAVLAAMLLLVSTRVYSVN